MKRIVLTLAIICLCAISNAQMKGISRGMRVDGTSNAHPAFFVRVSVNHSNHQYREGEEMIVNVRSSEDGYLYLFYEDANKNIVLLYPNQHESNNFIRKNTDVVIPPPNQVSGGPNFRITTCEPFGKECLLAIVTRKQLETPKSISLSPNATSISLSTLNDFYKELNGQSRGELAPGDWAEQAIETQTFPANPDSNPQENNKPKRFLATVCVSEYKYIPDAALPPCRKDAEVIRKVFIEKGIPSDNVFSLFDQDATMNNVKKLFCETLPRVTKPGDDVIIYWTGHGAQCADVNGDEKRSAYDSTLILYDSQRLDPETQLIDDDFGLWIQKLDGRKVLIILDACHSAGQASSKALEDSPWLFGFDEATVMKDLGQRDLAIIASSSSSQKSFIRKEKDMSVMTFYFTKALTEQRAWNHRTIYEKIRPQVKNYVEDTYFGTEQSVEIQDDMNPAMQLN